MPRPNHSSNTLSVSPATLNYRMPAEWEPHASTWLAWPHYHADWPGKFEPIPWVYTEIIRNLARHERVDLIVNDAKAEKQVRKLLDRANANIKNVTFHRWLTNRVWLRDSGCIFVRESSGHKDREGLDFSRADRDPKKTRALAPDGTLLAADFRFNAWAKYTNYRQDEKIGSRM